MPLSTGQTGRGVCLNVSDMATIPVWTTMANVTNIGLSGRQAEKIDFTHLKSDGGYREYRQGFKEAGEVSMTVHWDPDHATHEQMESLLTSGQVVDIEIDMTDAYPVAAAPKACFKVKAYISQLDVSANVDDPNSAEITWTLTGQGVWGPRHT